MQGINLSFVIPVYNVESYLVECLESILAQPHEGCEIILIDDGSTDGSKRICDTYASNPAITVVHKENGGLSSARNEGLLLAKGEYVTFLDSDDRIAPASLEHLLDWTQKCKADICFLEAIKFFPDGRRETLGDKIESKFVSQKTRKEVLDYLSTRPKYPGSACTKLYRNEFLKENDIHFPYDRRLSEDLGFCLKCIMKAHRFDAIDVEYYEYRQNRTGSITNAVSQRTFWDNVHFIKEAIVELTDNNIPMNDEAAYALSFAAYEYSVLLWYYSCIANTSEGAKAKEFMLQHKWILKYGRTKKTKLVNFVISMFGIDLGAYILNFYMKLRK